MIMAGDLDRHITFQRATVAYDSYNAQVKTWADAFTVWAGSMAIGSKELYQAQKVHVEASVVFKVRYTEKINNRMRIKYMGQYFEILGISNSDKRQSLVITCKEVA